MKLKLLPLLLAATAFATACGDDDDTTGPQGEARVRIVNIAPTAGDIDLLLDGNIIEEDIPYPFATAYEDVGAGNRNVEVRPTGTATSIIIGDVALSDGESHSLLVAGPGDDLRVDVLEDDLTAPTGGKAKVRLIHGAPSAGSVDIYVSAPGEALSASDRIVTGAAFGAFLDYIEVDPGDYEVRITPTGSLTPVIDEEISLSSGDIRTAIAVETAGGGAPFDALILDDTN